MSACTLSAGEMIERHVEVGGIESQTGEHLLDADLIDISAALFEGMLKRSITFERLLSLRGIGHFAFQGFQFPLHAH